MTFDITAIAHLFQIALTPAFLLTGTGAILGVISSRLSGALGRSKTLNLEVKNSGNPDLYAHEIRVVDQDCLMLNYSLIMATLSAFFTSLVIATLFCGQLISLGYIAQVISSIFFALTTILLSASLFLLFCSMLNGKKLLFALTKLGGSSQNN